MKLRADWLELEEVGSTQEAAAQVLAGSNREIGVVFAHHQVQGRGRFGREWVSKKGDSLTMSVIFWDYPDRPQPWLIGMASALATATAIGCNVRWPNDLSFGNLKTGGILTEILSTPGGERIPVVGIGINLMQRSFPPELPYATSVLKETGQIRTPAALAPAITDHIRQMPEPLDWNDLSEVWMRIDKTPGKRYKLIDGREGVALGIGDDAALRCLVDGEERRVIAADALFGLLACDA